VALDPQEAAELAHQSACAIWPVHPPAEARIDGSDVS
jgi:hypothetical protein